MSRLLSRADLLRGRATPQVETLRPPQAVREEEFQRLCDGCGKCVQVCPESIIRVAEDGLAAFEPTAGACTFCGDCTAACPTGALDKQLARPWTVKAEPRARCLSFNGIACRACEEACDEQAIRFRLMTGGRAMPLVDARRCTGCGACAHICPHQAIDLVSHPLEEHTG